MEGTLFVDANILLYADLTDSAFHRAARERLSYFLSTGFVLYISNQVLREYMSGMSRVMMNVGRYDPARLSTDVQRMECEYEVLEETGLTRRNLLQLLNWFPTGGKQVHDANIVATMQQYGIRKLLTNNVDDFKRFDSVIDVIPLIEQV